MHSLLKKIYTECDGKPLIIAVEQDSPINLDILERAGYIKAIISKFFNMYKLTKLGIQYIEENEQNDSDR